MFFSFLPPDKQSATLIGKPCRGPLTRSRHSSCTPSQISDSATNTDNVTKRSFGLPRPSQNPRTIAMRYCLSVGDSGRLHLSSSSDSRRTTREYSASSSLVKYIYASAFTASASRNCTWSKKARYNASGLGDCAGAVLEGDWADESIPGTKNIAKIQNARIIDEILLSPYTGPLAYDIPKVIMFMK